MLESFICSGCHLETWSQHDLAEKPHIECPAGVGNWKREGGLTPVATDEKACRADHAKLQAMRLAPKYCPECGERLSFR
jgi:hypothetical protein